MAVSTVVFPTTLLLLCLLAPLASAVGGLTCYKASQFANNTCPSVYSSQCCNTTGGLLCLNCQGGSCGDAPLCQASPVPDFKEPYCCVGPSSVIAEPLYCLGRSYFGGSTCGSPFQDSCCEVDATGATVQCATCSNGLCGTNNSCTDGLLYKYNVSECCNTLANYGTTRCYNTSDLINGTCPTGNGFSGNCCNPPVGNQPEQCIDCSKPDGLCGTGDQITSCSFFSKAKYQCCVDLTYASSPAPSASPFG